MSLAGLLKNAVWPQRPPPHPLILQNHERFTPGERYPQPIEECEFVVFDTELTGFSSKEDEIIAIGAVRIRGLKIICGETFYALVRPDERFQTKSTLVHRLTPGELHKAAGIDQVLPRFLDFCGDAFQVGHFVRLDLDFINRASRKYLGGTLRTPYLDTMLLAMSYYDLGHGSYGDHYNRQGSYTLAALSAEYGLPPFAEHNALQDSLQTAYLFLYLIKKMRNLGLVTLHQYLAAGSKRQASWWSF